MKQENHLALVLAVLFGAFVCSATAMSAEGDGTTKTVSVDEVMQSNTTVTVSGG